MISKTMKKKLFFINKKRGKRREKRRRQKKKEKKSTTDKLTRTFGTTSNDTFTRKELGVVVPSRARAIALSTAARTVLVRGAREEAEVDRGS